MSTPTATRPRARLIAPLTLLIATGCGTSSPSIEPPPLEKPSPQLPSPPPSSLLDKDGNDSLDRRLTISLSSGRDCGRVRLGGRNRREVDSCVKSCFDKNEHFHARYDQQGVDSAIARGVLFHDNGLWIIDYDSMGASEAVQFPGTFAYDCQTP